MKIAFTLSVVVLISFGLNFDYFNHIDYTGKYWPSQGKLKVGSSLSLKKDGRFDYQIFYLENAVYATQKIKGAYIVKGSKLQLIPSSFENTSNHFKHRNFRSPTSLKIKNEIEGIISSRSEPTLFKKQLTAFESGSLKLKPQYFIKQINKKISLCQMDLKTEKYNPIFKRE